MTIIVGIFFGVIFFSAQALLCVRAKSFAVKLAPVGLIILGFVFAWLCHASLGDDGGFIDGGSLFGAILATITVISAIGDAMAWLVYYLMTKRR